MRVLKTCHVFQVSQWVWFWTNLMPSQTNLSNRLLLRRKRHLLNTNLWGLSPTIFFDWEYVNIIKKRGGGGQIMLQTNGGYVWKGRFQQLLISTVAQRLPLVPKSWQCYWLVVYSNGLYIRKWHELLSLEPLLSTTHTWTKWHRFFMINFQSKNLLHSNKNVFEFICI